MFQSEGTFTTVACRNSKSLREAARFAIKAGAIQEKEFRTYVRDGGNSELRRATPSCAAVAQPVERVLGKDEVMGSIPISSF